MRRMFVATHCLMNYGRSLLFEHLCFLVYKNNVLWWEFLLHDFMPAELFGSTFDLPSELEPWGVLVTTFLRLPPIFNDL